jgi:transposase
MALRQGNREQMELLPPSIEQYVAANAPVRVYDAFVEALDLEALGIKVAPDREGNPAYEPRSMLKLLVYSYSYGVRSSRKIERELHNNLSFIWLMKGLKPDHKTIAEFRRHHKEALQQALRQCVRLCLRLDLIAGNILFVDGSKIRGNASLKNSWDRDKIQRVLAQADQKIIAILKEAEAMDEEEEGSPSLISLPTQLSGPRVIQEKVVRIMEELQASGKKSWNTTDPECAGFNGVKGSGAGYSVEVVVDDKQGLIVSADAAGVGNDFGQLSTQIQQATQVLGHIPEVTVADAGFSDMADLSQVDSRIKLLVPNKQQVNALPISEYAKQKFHYLAERDCYLCPQGEELKFRNIMKKNGNRSYRMAHPKACQACQHYGKCTTAKYGRTLERLPGESLKEYLEQIYVLPENQTIYKRRQAKIELVFGHLKHNLGLSSFLLRGRDGARAEISLLSICFNLRRLITLLGVPVLIQKLKEVASSKISQACNIKDNLVFYSLDVIWL